MKKLILLIVIGFVSSSCLRMDSFLYNPDDSISEYLLDDFKGETEIDLDPIGHCQITMKWC